MNPDPTEEATGSAVATIVTEVPVDAALARAIERAAEKCEQVKAQHDACRARRDELIRHAHEAGGSLREIARLAKLSPPSVIYILGKDAEGGA